MLGGPAWLYAVSHAFALWGGRTGGDCRCIIEGPGIDAQVLGLLQRQLDRCGPANLTCPACPACPICGPVDPAVGYLASVGVLVFLVGVVVGVVSGLAWVRVPAAPAVETAVSRAKSVAPVPAPEPQATAPPSLTGGVLTPAAKRALRLF